MRMCRVGEVGMWSLWLCTSFPTHPDCSFALNELAPVLSLTSACFSYCQE